jgi:hypothetical protein
MNRASAFNDKQRNFNRDKVFGDTCFRALFATLLRDPPPALHAVPGHPLPDSNQLISDGFTATAILFSS